MFKILSRKKYTNLLDTIENQTGTIDNLKYENTKLKKLAEHQKNKLINKETQIKKLKEQLEAKHKKSKIIY